MAKKTIGRIDKADFPALELYDLDIKIDTGAYTSSIHCHSAKVEENELICIFHEEDHPLHTGKEVRFKEFKTARVKSSNGIIQRRYKVKTTIVIFDKKYSINLTLSMRDDMRFPVLIGRRFLSNKFIVDVTKKNISYLTKKQ